MISIIICSVNASELKRVKDNIHDTIGCDYEIISIDNKEGHYGICEAYNRGASIAKGDILCFMHEDISFETRNWGTKVKLHFSDPSVGLIGIAGGSSKSLIPSSWSPAIFNSEINLVQHFKFSERKSSYINKTSYPDDAGMLRKVVAIDGVWMCIPKKVFTRFRFDEKTFEGFHGYDIDLSLQVYSEYSVCVVFDILIHHYSEGSFNQKWMESMILLSRKWKPMLPASVQPLTRETIVAQHWTCMRSFLIKLIELDYTRVRILYYLFIYSMNGFFRFSHFMSCFKMVLSGKLALTDKRYTSLWKA
jgi:glycosyltransferase involved in cell wall biosynthesis